MAARPCTGSLAIIWKTASSVKKSPSFLGSFHALRKSRTACSFCCAPFGCSTLCLLVRSLRSLTWEGLAAGAGLRFVELLRRHQHGARLRTLGWADDSAALEEVHETAG